jgi:zeaxanthin glucosyltransferase
MNHFGIILPPVSGHLYPFAALGRELLKRGHHVTVFQMADLERRVRAEGLDFAAIGASDHPAGSLPASLAEIGRRRGLSALRYTMEAIRRTTEMICRDAPAALSAAGVSFLLVDQTEPAGGSVAEHLGLPFATVCCALALNREPFMPPPFTGWDYSASPWAAWRNRAGFAAWDGITASVARTVARYRSMWKLPPYKVADDAYSPLLQISQQTAAFDFPRQRMPPAFHYVGPLRDDSPAPLAFPWERLDGRPLVYASLGTLQNRQLDIFRTIAEACAPLEVQLILAGAAGWTEGEIKRLPGSPIVVSFAPQRALLKRAALVVSHAGLNTMLDAMEAGLPVVAIPITYEQPAIAARLRWIGAGRILPLRRLSAERLRRQIREVLSEGCYRAKAETVARTIQSAGGVRRAADLIDHAARA